MTIPNEQAVRCLRNIAEAFDTRGDLVEFAVFLDDEDLATLMRFRSGEIADAEQKGKS